MQVLTDQDRGFIETLPKGMLIGGEWRAAEGGATIPVEDPATGEVLAEIADATAADAVAALDAAVAAQPGWAKWAPRERGDILRRAYERIMAERDQLARLMTLEMGKPLAEAQGEVTYAAEYFRWFSEESVRIAGRYAEAPDGAGRLLVMKQPVGPCLLITPWNFPLAMGTRKIGPAIAAGCTMVVKPAQKTPLSMLALARILAECGLPDGVLNIVVSSSASRVIDPLMKDQRLRKLSFTGSTEVGRKLVAASADSLLRCSMELGGNAPFIVFDDADLDAAVEGAVLAKMRNVGEACTAANRIYVQEKIADRFAAALGERLAAMRVGPGLQEGVEVGPLIDEEQRRKVAELAEDAISRGAEVVVGGGVRPGPGYFFDPTVIDRVPGDARLLREEIFGPVAAITRFQGEAEVLAAANATEHGLVAYLFTRDLSRAIRVTEALETGMVGLNRGLVSNPAAPFGGVKASGFGREGGPEGIEEYLSMKYVALDFDQEIA